MAGPLRRGRKTLQVSLDEFDLLPLLLQRSVLERGQVSPTAAAAPGFAELKARHADRSWHPSISGAADETISELVDPFLASSDSAVVIGERWLTAGRHAVERTLQLVQAVALLGAEDRIFVAAGEANSAGLFDLLPDAEADLTRMARLLDGDASGISVLFVCGDDLLRAAPYRAGLQKALASVETIVEIDRFPGEVCRLADVVLPSAAFGELDGTVTNMLGTVQRWRRVVPPPGDARPERDWFGLIARRLGDDAWPRTPFEWWTTEPALDSPYRVDRLTPLYQGTDWVQWPFREEEEPLALVPPRSSVCSPVSEDYPMQVIFTRHAANWMPGGWSSRDEILRRESIEAFINVSPQDLEEKGIKSGGRVKLLTPDGAAVFPARGDSRVPRGLLVLAEVPGDNELPKSVLAVSDSGVAFQPVACRLEKV